MAKIAHLAKMARKCGYQALQHVKHQDRHHNEVRQGNIRDYPIQLRSFTRRLAMPEARYTEDR